VLRRALLGLSRNERAKTLLTRAPVAAEVVDRFVAGETTDDAVTAARRLTEAGLLVSIDHLGEDTTERADAERVVTEYVTLLTRLSDAGLAGSTEVSVKLTALGQALGHDGPDIARENVATICWAAQRAGTMVTLDMEDHTTTDGTLATLAELRHEFPDTGAVLQAYLRRTEADCRDLAYAGSRVRLCKGAYAEPESVAFRSPHDVSLSYVRCLKVLMAGEGYPMLATHDPTLIAIGRTVAQNLDRASDTFEFQMLYGIRPGEQKRLAGLGHRVRVYVPYGRDWYAYLVRRLAERPANLGFFARSLVTKN
jgi:proline dehydrogenase